MSRVVIVGSGASGVHFAATALRNGHEVVMLDVGREKPSVIGPDLTFEELKAQLPDPVDYFLGSNFEAVIRPASKGEVYTFPPSKQYAVAGLTQARTQSTGFEPLASFARGGLAEVWTAGVYPFNDDDLADFPLSYGDLERYYGLVAQRMGVNGAADDLARFYPVHDHLIEPLYLDQHSSQLLRAYQRHRPHLNHELGCHLGRSRVATLSKRSNGRDACSYCGRCLWGCPSGALYTPSITLEECLRHPRFQYRPELYVRHFTYDDRRITSLIADPVSGGDRVEIPVERLVLAAGTLSTSRIFLESIFRRTGEVMRLPGLMDNRQILMPYINWRMIGASYEPNSYQYHQVAIGMTEEDPRAYVHGQITTLTTGLVHPIIDTLPCDLGTALMLFRQVRSALGIVNINLHDTRRADSYVTLAPGNGAEPARLVVNYSSAPNEAARIKQVVSRVRQAMRRLGCIVPLRMVHPRPMGASVHYSGTLPMSTNAAPFTVTRNCQSNDFSNLFIADGSSFPFLPAKNLTFTLMANATRIADEAF